MNNYIAPFKNIDTTHWKSVTNDQLSSKDCSLYEKRKKAIDMFLSGKISLKEITIITSVKKPEIYRLISRCLSLDDRGEIWGYRALIPNKRIKKANFSEGELGKSRGYDKVE